MSYSKAVFGSFFSFWFVFVPPIILACCFGLIFLASCTCIGEDLPYHVQAENAQGSAVSICLTIHEPKQQEFPESIQVYTSTVPNTPTMAEQWFEKKFDFHQGEYCRIVTIDPMQGGTQWIRAHPFRTYSIEKVVVRYKHEDKKIRQLVLSEAHSYDAFVFNMVDERPAVPTISVYSLEKGSGSALLQPAAD